jgi:hypothetical protein
MEMTPEEVATVSQATSSTVKALAIEIMALHDDDGLSYMEIADLAGYLDVSVRTIERALHDGADIIVNLDPDETDSMGLYFIAGERADIIKRKLSAGRN